MLTFSEDAEPPATKFAQLIEKDQNFWSTWQEQRTDLPDESPSGYSLALASMAVKARWTDQETIDLLIAWRRERHHHQILREDYYARILQGAKTPMARLAAQERLIEAMDQNAEDWRDNVRRSLNSIYGIEITRLVRFAGDPPSFWMQTDKNDITLGSVHNLCDQRAFRDMVAAATGIRIPKCGEDAWQQRAQALLHACEDVDVGEASHPVTETRGWIEQYISNNPVSDDVNDAARRGRPLNYCGYIHIQLLDFRAWIYHNTGENLRPRDVAVRLRLCEAAPVAVPVKTNGHPSTRGYWRIFHVPLSQPEVISTVLVDDHPVQRTAPSSSMPDLPFLLDRSGPVIRTP